MHNLIEPYSIVWVYMGSHSQVYGQWQDQIEDQIRKLEWALVPRRSATVDRSASQAGLS